MRKYHSAYLRSLAGPAYSIQMSECLQNSHLELGWENLTTRNNTWTGNSSIHGLALTSCANENNENSAVNGRHVHSLDFNHKSCVYSKNMGNPDWRNTIFPVTFEACSNFAIACCHGFHWLVMYSYRIAVPDCIAWPWRRFTAVASVLWFLSSRSTRRLIVESIWYNILT